MNLCIKSVGDSIGTVPFKTTFVRYAFLEQDVPLCSMLFLEQDSTRIFENTNKMCSKCVMGSRHSCVKNNTVNKLVRIESVDAASQ